MNRRTKITIIIGIVVLLASCIIYGIVSPEYYLSVVLGFGFLLYSELVFFGGFVFTECWANKSSQIITRAGIGIPVEIYAIIVFASSFIYMNSKSSHAKGFLILQIILFVIILAITLITASASKSAKTNDSEVFRATSVLNMLVDRLTLIKEMTEKKPEIEKLIDGIRFSDTSVTVAADTELNNAVSNLENIVKADEFDGNKFERAIKEIDLLIKTRVIQTKAEKQNRR